MSEPSEPKEHGIRDAFYSNGPLAPVAVWSRARPRAWGYAPVLECLCGYIARDRDWASAGQDFDEHLAEQPDQSLTKSASEKPPT